MARIFITGSTDGLGRAAAHTLMGEGHSVVLHARSRDRAAALVDNLPDAEDVVIGDLSSSTEVLSVAEQVNRIGRMDAIIQNAGIYLESRRGSTPNGHATTFAVNVLAPYLLTASIERPDRLIYISSGMHLDARGSLDDIDWSERQWSASQAYCESKLFLTTLGMTVARHWPDVLSNVVDPGWVPTKMGGAAATDDLEMGHLTQSWLATSQDPAAMVSGGYWHHLSRQSSARETLDPGFQDQLMAKLLTFTGTELF